MKGLKTYILHLGDGNVDSNYFVGSSTVGTVANPHEEHMLLRHPYVSVLIDHPEAGWILFDTGPTRHPERDCTPGMQNRCIFELPEECSMESQLALVGLTPKDIKHVIISHLHNDHLGNAHLFAETADFYVAKAEMAEAACRILEKPHDIEYAATAWYLRDEVFQPVKQWHYIEDDYELFPGIDVLTLPGHTACVLGLLIHNENQPVLVCSDAINESRNYEYGIQPSYLFDSLGWVKSIEKVKRLQKKYNARLVFGHDENQFYNELKLAPEYYD